MTDHDYRITELRDVHLLDVLFRRGEWRSWGEAIDWLRGDGMDDSELSAHDAERLVGELRLLESDRTAFTPDPHLAAQLLRAHEIAHC